MSINFILGLVCLGFVIARFLYPTGGHYQTEIFFFELFAAVLNLMYASWKFGKGYRK